MYTTMTAKTKVTIGDIGHSVLVPCETSKRDGCIWFWLLNPLRMDEQPVRLLRGRPLQPGTAMWDEDFLDTADVIEALERGDGSGLEQLVLENLAGDPEVAEKAVKNPMAYACAQLASGLDGAKFVVWWRDLEQRLDVGIYSNTPRAAAYAYLLVDGIKRFPAGKCPECGKRVFRSGWHPRTYCSNRCRNTHNVRESRKRKVSTQKKSQDRESGRRSAAHGTHKAR